MKRRVSDEELMYLIREGNETAEDCLTTRYRRYILPMVVSILRRHSCTDRDDAGQLAFVGIRKAMNRYRPDRSASFHGFAVLCAEREIDSYIRHEYAKGLFTAGKMLSIDRQVSGEYETSASEMIPNRIPEYEPVWVFQYNELKREAEEVLNGLNESDRTVYKLWHNRDSYREIGRKTGKTVKQVDLCIQRVKNRLRKRIDYRY